MGSGPGGHGRFDPNDQSDTFHASAISNLEAPCTFIPVTHPGHTLNPEKAPDRKAERKEGIIEGAQSPMGGPRRNRSSATQYQSSMYGTGASKKTFQVPYCTKKSHI